MKTSVIRHRVADFLKTHPPFDVLSEADLLDLAGSGRVKFHESDEYVFRQGDAKGPVVWIIQQGRVELIEERPSGEHVRDALGEGDILGLDRFAGEGACQCSARTATDVILYGIAAAAFESLVPRYPAVKRYVTAHASVSGAVGFGRTSWLDAEPPPADFLRARLVTIPAGALRADWPALVVSARNGAAALIDAGARAVGVATPLEVCAGIPARPCPPAVTTFPATRTAIRVMLNAGCEELAITADGTSDSPLEALLTASDLALFCGHNPVRLVREIRNASAAAELAPLLKRAARLVLDGLAQPLDVDDCCRIGTSVVAAAAEACIRLAGDSILAAGIDPPGAPFCWVMFGESARGDLLTPMAPTIAAVYDDSDPGSGFGDSMYFAAVVGETLAWFHDCGWDASAVLWPDGSRPSMPLSEWRRLYSETIRNPLANSLYSRRGFFDVRALSGEAVILKSLQTEIAAELREHRMTVALLANDTLAHLPPLTFFRSLVLGIDEMQRDSFDFATSAVAPLADAARVLAIAGGRLDAVNTLARLQAAQSDFPDAAAMLGEAADAFRIALYYQTLSGGSRAEAGPLGRFDQLLLRTAFASIQRLLEFTESTLLGDL